MALTLKDIHPLLDQARGDGLVLSCYVDLATNRALPVSWPGSFQARATAVRELLAENPEALGLFERDFRAVGQAVESPDVVRGALRAGSAHGLAVFSAIGRGFFRCYELDVPVADELVVHQSPYLVPLLGTMVRQGEYLVVHADTHRGRLYAAGPGGVRLLREVEGEVPRKQHSSGERWGKQQATIARHREDRVLRFRKELAGLIEKVWDGQPFRGIVLLGQHEILERLQTRLPPRLAERVVTEGPHPWSDRPQAIGATVRGMLADVTREGEQHLLGVLGDRLRERAAVAKGPNEVIEALQSGRVGPKGHGFLVLGPDPREAVARCTGCRSLFADMPAACPRCRAACAEANLWEELLLFALRHQIAVHCLGTGEPLAPYGGVVAALAGTPAEAAVTS